MATVMPAPAYLESDLDHPQFHSALYEVLAASDKVRNAVALGGLQQAHDDLPAGGGAIWLPPGSTFTPTSSVTISKPCAIIMGHGSKIEHGGTSGFFDLLHVTSAVDGFALVGSGVVDGRFGAGRTGGGGNLLLNGCSRAWVDGIRFINAADMAIIVEGCSDTWISRSRFLNSGGGFVKYGGQNRRGVLSDCRFDTVQNAAVFFDQPGAGLFQRHMTVERSKFRNTQRSGDAGRAAIQTFGNGASSEEWFRDFQILDNDIFNDVQPTAGSTDLVGIGLDQLSDGLVRGNKVTMVPFASGGDGEGIIVNGPRNKICSNHVRFQSAGGIGLLSYGGAGNLVKDCVVCCNTVEGNGQATGQGINYVATNAAGNAVSGLLIANNRLFNNGYGIQTYNNGGTLNGNNNFIVGNNATGNITGAYSFVANSGQTLSANLPAS
jgi:hypothetical protein